jgi:hypothetical protein
VPLKRKVPVTRCGINKLGLVDLMLVAALGIEHQSVRSVKRVTTGDRPAGWQTWELEVTQTHGETRSKQQIWKEQIAGTRLQCLQTISWRVSVEDGRNLWANQMKTK